MAKDTFVRTKPHVNVGTIGHIDHGKTTLTAALLAVQGAKGLAKFKSYADIAKGGTVRDETKTVTIAVSHVEYEIGGQALCPHRLPRPRGLHQEHDHRSRPDGRRDPGGVRRRRPDAPNPRAHPLGPPGERARLVVFLNKCDLVDDEELLELVEMEVRELLSKYDFPGDDIPVIRGNAKGGLSTTPRIRPSTPASANWWMPWTATSPNPNASPTGPS